MFARKYEEQTTFQGESISVAKWVPKSLWGKDLTSLKMIKKLSEPPVSKQWGYLLWKCH